MNIGKAKVDIQDGILIMSIKDVSMKLDEVKELKSLMEENTGKKYYYVIFANALGYYSGYDFELCEYVYCGSLNILRNIEKMKAHIRNKSNTDEE